MSTALEKKKKVIYSIITLKNYCVTLLCLQIVKQSYLFKDFRVTKNLLKNKTILSNLLSTSRAPMNPN